MQTNNDNSPYRFEDLEHPITLNLSPSNSFKRNIELMAAHYDNIIEGGHGMFFDFSDTPEYEKPVLDWLVKNYNWILEKPFFIRKPED